MTHLQLDWPGVAEILQQVQACHFSAAKPACLGWLWTFGDLAGGAHTGQDVLEKAAGLHLLQGLVHLQPQLPGGGGHAAPQPDLVIRQQLGRSWRERRDSKGEIRNQKGKQKNRGLLEEGKAGKGGSTAKITYAPDPPNAKDSPVSYTLFLRMAHMGSPSSFISTTTL